MEVLIEKLEEIIYKNKISNWVMSYYCHKSQVLYKYKVVKTLFTPY